MQTNNIIGTGINKPQFVDSLRKVRKTVETEFRKVFAIPDNEAPPEIKKAEESSKNIQNLDRVLSAEEKKLFELLFPVTMESAKTGRTFKSYAVQQKFSAQSKISNKRILGSNLDIKG